MDKPTIRTSIDLPGEFHRKLHEAAACRGCSARQMILGALEQALAFETRKPRKRLSLNPPIVASVGKPFDLTNEQIYELIEFP